MSRYFSNDDYKNSFAIPSELLKDTNLYVYEYSIRELLGQMKSQGNMVKNTFCLKNVGTIKYSIWTN